MSAIERRTLAAAGLLLAAVACGDAKKEEAPPAPKPAATKAVLRATPTAQPAAPAPATPAIVRRQAVIDDSESVASPSATQAAAALGSGQPTGGATETSSPSPSSTRRSKADTDGRRSGRSYLIDGRYTVEEGDTLSGIAAFIYKDARKADELLAANRAVVKDAKHLIPGTVLLLPR